MSNEIPYAPTNLIIISYDNIIDSILEQIDMLWPGMSVMMNVKGDRTIICFILGGDRYDIDYNRIAIERWFKSLEYNGKITNLIHLFGTDTWSYAV
jgi:hypothetical protein